MRNSEILINEFKKKFREEVGRAVKIVICSRWESEANFTEKGNFWAIVKTIFDYTGWKWSETFTTSRAPEQILRRNIIDYISVNNGVTLVSIGRETKRDHTTVLNSIQKFEARLETEHYYQKMFTEILNYVKENYHMFKERATLKQEILKSGD